MNPNGVWLCALLAGWIALVLFELRTLCPRPVSPPAAPERLPAPSEKELQGLRYAYANYREDLARDYQDRLANLERWYARELSRLANRVTDEPAGAPK